MQDLFADLKAKQRDGWKHFTPTEIHTTRPAAHLVRVAGVAKGQKVLDVGCGTGPTTITAARLGAKVTGLDLTPELLARGKENAALAGVDDIVWKEGDAEALPFKDGEFDVVISQFGHMFAPRPEVAAAEMLRVLRPGGTIAFNTWPPESATGQMFALVGKYLPPPAGVPPVGQWGHVDTVRQRLGDKVKDLAFFRGVMEGSAMSPQHYRRDMETTSAPILKLYQEQPGKKESFQKELDAIFARYHHDNAVRFEYLVTRATKA
jgi:SAM-dependent methyltransferase